MNKAMRNISSLEADLWCSTDPYFDYYQEHLFPTRSNRAYDPYLKELMVLLGEVITDATDTKDK